jgi:hypothetical protein
MKIHLRKESSIDRRLARVLKRYHASLQQPSMEQLKRDLSLIRVITSSLNRASDELRGEEARWRCPFHRERVGREDLTPSFWARDNHQGKGVGRWGCNSCGAGSGDVFDWVQQYHVLPQKAAVLYLRRHYEQFRL